MKQTLSSLKRLARYIKPYQLTFFFVPLLYPTLSDCQLLRSVTILQTTKRLIFLIFSIV